MSSTTPLKTARLASLSVTWALAVAACGTGLNALVKFSDEEDLIKSRVPRGTVVDINVSDVHTTGIIACTICLLTAIITSIYVLFLVLPLSYRSSGTPLATRTLRLQWMTLAFCAAFIFAAQTAFTVFFATRSAKVTAFIGNTQLPQSVVDGVEKSLGVTSVYKHIGYLRLAAVFPWLTIVALLITIGITITAISHARNPDAVRASSSSPIAEKSEMKDREELQERV
ncbi:hypothetical protein HGRIS_014309 [Hohenbuehelia grisea]|uniref:Uncharacterized protein n=1 Tax=Hohenbuehelia grisea TaxID=104357 RepID=A0ABR3JUF2_9AGAR